MSYELFSQLLSKDKKKIKLARLLDYYQHEARIANPIAQAVVRSKISHWTRELAAL